MTPFKFSLPAKAPGVYVFKHEPTGLLYIGAANNLHRRFQEWRSVINSGSYNKSLAIAEKLRETRPQDWTFYVMAEFSSYDEAVENEKQLIRAMIEASPGMLLNTIGHHGNQIKSAGPIQGSIITDKNWKQYTYAAAAEVLGCTKETLVKRLAKYRARGITEVTIETLRERTGGRPKSS